MTGTEEPQLYAVIPAGGSGTRLWPLSRASHPKFLHALTGTDRSLLQATVDRLAPLSPPATTYVVTGVSHAAAVARQLPELADENILVEPAPRDSCAAIGLAAAVIAQRDPDAVMGSFPADHLIGDPDRFVAVTGAAVVAARQGYLTTIGITPTRPETGLGYLRCGPPLGGAARLTEEFKEKPSYDTAVAYVDSGRYLWNAGMFVFRVEAFLAELARQRPALYDGLARIAAAWGSPARETVFGEVWPTLEKISVDYAVMEGAAAAGKVATVPGDFSWSDIGNFHELGSALTVNGATGPVVLGEKEGEVLAHDTEDTVVVPRSGRLVATLGLRGMVVVDTPDAVLVCPRDRAQDVKKLVDTLRERGDESYV